MNTFGWTVREQTFHDVFIQGTQLHFQKSSNLTGSTLTPLAQDFLNSSPSSGQCITWIEEHVIANLVDGIDPRNFYHFMFNIFQPLFDTLLRRQASVQGLSLLQMLIDCMQAPACPQTSSAILVQPLVVNTPFSYLLEALGTRMIPLRPGTCFKSIQFAQAHSHHMSGLPSSMHKVSICDLSVSTLEQDSSMFGCSDILHATFSLMSRWVSSVVFAKHPDQPHGHDLLADLRPTQTLVTLVDRQSSRLLLNKVAVIERALLDLKVLFLTTDFSHGLHDTISTLQQTYILLAVHGQALANVMFMKPGSVVLEIFPYGWLLAAGLSGDVVTTETWSKHAR